MGKLLKPPHSFTFAGAGERQPPPPQPQFCMYTGSFGYLEPLFLLDFAPYGVCADGGNGQGVAIFLQGIFGGDNAGCSSYTNLISFWVRVPVGDPDPFAGGVTGDYIFTPAPFVVPTNNIGCTFSKNTLFANVLGDPSLTLDAYVRNDYIYGELWGSSFNSYVDCAGALLPQYLISARFMLGQQLNVYITPLGTYTLVIYQNMYSSLSGQDFLENYDSLFNPQFDPLTP
jgi:hypothetical protein